MSKKVDMSALDAALEEMLKGAVTLWELKQHVDQLVLKFGRDRRIVIVDAWPYDEVDQ